MSIEHSIAAEKIVAIDGKEYQLAPLCLSDYGLLVRHLKDVAHDPRPAARRLAATLPDDEAKAVLADAVNDYRANVLAINVDHAVDYIFANGDGMSWGVWLAMQRHHAGELSRDAIYQWLAKCFRKPERKRDLERIALALAELSGVHEIPNSPAAGEAAKGEANQIAQRIGT